MSNTEESESTRDEHGSPGFPKTRKGEERRKQILEAAKQLLIQEGCMRFNLRSVASEAGLSLSNVQYYFASKEDLVRGLMSNLVELYSCETAGLRASVSGSPVERFLALIDYLIEMVTDQEVRYFFIQLWALICSVDPNKDKLLSELYLTDILNIRTVLEELNPLLSKGALQQRSTMIASMLEGMMLMFHDADIELADGEEKMSAQLRRQALRIALEP